jgi:lantibiotic modifying enzyme
VLRAAPGPQTDLGFGAAGTGVFLLRLWEAAPDDRYLAGAVRCGEWLDHGAVRDRYGCHWPRGPLRRGHRWHWTGFETGAAGIGYFLLALAQATRRSRWADVAREVEATLAGQARRDGAAVSWPPTLAGFGEGGAEFNEQEPGRRWQWCSGASGIGLFYARAAEVLGEAAFLETAVAAGEGTWAHGDVRRNPSQCHGLAGSVDLFLVLHRLTQAAVWRERALDFARQALAYRAATAAGDAWPADDPEQPGLYSPDFGWGGAGVGHGFLRVLAPDRVSMPLT